MPVDLYTTVASPTGRAVQLTAAALGVKLNLVPFSFDAKDHLTPEFLKLNPQHTVPTIVDDGFSLWESRAITRYLVYKYGGEESSLYPKDPQARSVVDQRLDFDLGTLSVRFSQYFYPQRQGNPPDPELLKKLEEALGFLNTFLEGSQYVAGDSLTIADFSLVATVSTIEVIGINLKQFDNIVKWYELVKSTAPDYEEANGKGVEACRQLIADMLKKPAE